MSKHHPPPHYTRERVFHEAIAKIPDLEHPDGPIPSPFIDLYSLILEVHGAMRSYMADDTVEATAYLTTVIARIMIITERHGPREDDFHDEHHKDDPDHVGDDQAAEYACEICEATDKLKLCQACATPVCSRCVGLHHCLFDRTPAR